MRHISRAGVALTVALLCAGALQDGLEAEAALAVGQPPDLTKQGLAMGWALNYATKEAAQAEALKRCRGYRDAPAGTRELCKIVESFRISCLAVAIDPDYGTTGFGWGV